MPTTTLDILPVSCFRVPSHKPGDPGATGDPQGKPAEKASEPEEAILCRQCCQVLTHSSERISIAGAHRHVFANPHGIVFEIGCFRRVQGCGVVGQATSEWSWFKGFSWRILICSMCLTHLGWLFTSSGAESFNGLILDRLIESRKVQDG